MSATSARRSSKPRWGTKSTPLPACQHQLNFIVVMIVFLRGRNAGRKKGDDEGNHCGLSRCPLAGDAKQESSRHNLLSIMSSVAKAVTATVGRAVLCAGGKCTQSWGDIGNAAPGRMVIGNRSFWGVGSGIKFVARLGHETSVTVPEVGGCCAVHPFDPQTGSKSGDSYTF